MLTIITGHANKGGVLSFYGCGANFGIIEAYDALREIFKKEGIWLFKPSSSHTFPESVKMLPFVLLNPFHCAV